MSSLTADSGLQSSLAQAKEITEILGPDGKLLGYFTPAALANQIPLTRLASLFDPEELRRRMASTETGHTIEQVMEHLRSME